MVNSEEVRSKFRQLERLLASTTNIRDCCVHESGHLIYFRRAGLTDFAFRGPHVYYNPALGIGSFVASVAPSISQLQSTLIRDLAIGAAAGGVFTSVICGHEYRGDAEDRRLFEHFATPSSGFSNPDDIWRQAVDVVEHDLRIATDEFKNEINRTVAEIARKCFDIDPPEKVI